MGLFDGKQGVITGVANGDSIAWAIADEVMKEGGKCAFTHLPDRPDDERRRNRRRVELLIKDNPLAPMLVPMNVRSDEEIAGVAAQVEKEMGKIDFLLHSIAFADRADLNRDTVETSREGFLMAMDISAYSLLSLCNQFKHMMNPGASVLAMTYYGGEKAVPGYNVMGVCKAALDSCVKYAAFDLGAISVRVNAVSAGPVRTLAGRAAGVDEMLKLYSGMAPLCRNVTHQEVGKTGAFLMSTMSEGITGEILHVDAGYHIMGSPGRLLEQFKES